MFFRKIYIVGYENFNKKKYILNDKMHDEI